MQDKAIALHDVDLSLGRGAARVHILKGISLEVDRSEAVGLIERGPAVGLSSDELAFYPLLIILFGLGDLPQILIAFMLAVVAVSSCARASRKASRIRATFSAVTPSPTLLLTE